MIEAHVHDKDLFVIITDVHDQDLQNFALLVSPFIGFFILLITINVFSV